MYIELPDTYAIYCRDEGSAAVRQELSNLKAALAASDKERESQQRRFSEQAGLVAVLEKEVENIKQQVCDTTISG
jgi:hypothetical protein